MPSRDVDAFVVRCAVRTGSANQPSGSSILDRAMPGNPIASKSARVEVGHAKPERSATLREAHRPDQLTAPLDPPIAGKPVRLDLDRGVTTRAAGAVPTPPRT